MKATIERLVREVEEQKTVNQSAVSLIKGLSDQLRAAVDSGDLEKARKALDDLDASQQALAEAITANTPAQADAGQADAGQGQADQGTDEVDQDPNGDLAGSAQDPNTPRQ